MELNFEKNNGLVIAIAQDWNTGQVLMVGHANPIAVEKSFNEGLATFWSTSRNELWTKGKTSGDTLEIRQIRADCDGDAILYLVEPQGEGGACHKSGWFSCFKNKLVIRGVHSKPRLVGEPTEKIQTLTVQKGYKVVESSSEVRSFSRLMLDLQESVIRRSVNIVSRVSEDAALGRDEIAFRLLYAAQDLVDKLRRNKNDEVSQKRLAKSCNVLIYCLLLSLSFTRTHWSDLEAHIQTSSLPELPNKGVSGND